MKLIKKPFPYSRVLKLVEEMNKNNITTQACFVLGYPGETDIDLDHTKRYIKQLVKAGISEIALFILTTVPGSVVYHENKDLQPPNPSDMTFTPKWRNDFRFYERTRNRFYIYFILWRLRYFHVDVMIQPLRIVRKSFRTKMEITFPDQK